MFEFWKMLTMICIFPSGLQGQTLKIINSASLTEARYAWVQEIVKFLKVRGCWNWHIPKWEKNPLLWIRWLELTSQTELWLFQEIWPKTLFIYVSSIHQVFGENFLKSVGKLERLMAQRPACHTLSSVTERAARNIDWSKVCQNFKGYKYE